MDWFEDLMVAVCLVGIAVGFLASWLNARAERKMWEELGAEGGEKA